MHPHPIQASVLKLIISFGAVVDFLNIYMHFFVNKLKLKEVPLRNSLISSPHTDSLVCGTPRAVG